MKTIKLTAPLALVAVIFSGMLSIGMANPYLADSKDCLSCHSVDDQSIGPAYKDVAEKYAGKQDAEAMLIKKVMHGGSGTWGTTRMPANSQVNEEEARILVEWILSQNKVGAIK